MLRTYVLYSAVACLAFVPAQGLAQTTADIEETATAAAELERSDELNALRTALADNYAFPQRVRDIMAKLERIAATGRYDDLDDGEFAKRLSEDLVSATDDSHFLVGVDTDDGSAVGFDSLADAQSNYGFVAAEIIEGNIGYLRLDNFSKPDLAFETASASLKMLENVEGLIIDLRYNNGGYNELAQFLASHLFSGEKDQLLISYYYNQDGKRIERGQWVLGALPGRRLPDIPVHVLTSSVTFSAAEWMAFSLQQTNRAIVVGAQTAGGGHPVNRFPLTLGLFIQIPIGEIRGPNGGEFEGIGVTPDVEVPSHSALAVSHYRMLEALATAEPTPAREWTLAAVRGKLAPIELDEGWLRSLAGRYSGRELRYQQGVLSYRWRDRYELKLTPLSKRLFAVEGTEDYRIAIIGDGQEVTAIRRIFADGSEQNFEKAQ